MHEFDFFYGNHWDMGWVSDWPDHPFDAEPNDEFCCTHCLETPEDHVNWPDVLADVIRRLQVMDIDYLD